MQNHKSQITNHKSQKGQALITLIFFVLIAITITSGAIIMIAVNSTSLGKFQEGNISLDAAEAGIENAILRVIRDTSYTGETSLPVGNETVDITVTGSNPKTITAVGTGNFKRKVQVKMTLSSGYYTVSEWKEI